jgi:hypothetical protein
MDVRWQQRLERNRYFPLESAGSSPAAASGAGTPFASQKEPGLIPSPEGSPFAPVQVH